MLEEAENLMQHGSFEPALDLIDSMVEKLEEFSSEYIQVQILKSRAYYHLARVDQALYFVDQVIKSEDQIAIDDITRIHLYALKAIYQLGLGHYRQGETTLEYVEEYEDILEEHEEYQILSHIYYAKGDLAHSLGEIEEAIDYYTQSLDYKYHGGENYELNFLLYKLGVMYRMQGLLGKSKEFLRESLIISRELSMAQEHATAATMLGQDALMTNQYNEARGYLEEGYAQWKNHGSVFGIMWALGELAILDYLEGNTDQAVANYELLLEQAREVLPLQQLSVHLLNLIRFCVTNQDKEKGAQYLEEFSRKISEVTEVNAHIEGRFQLANILMSTLGNRVRSKFSSLTKLENLANHEDIYIRLDSLLMQSQLLLFEYSITEEQLVKQKILNEADDKIDLVLNYIHNKSNITYELHVASLRAQIEYLRKNQEAVLEFVEILREQEIKIHDEETHAITRELISFPDLDDFEFSREFQSIPKIKVLLYLLPRTKVPFTELQNGTALSSGNLNGQVDKLVELGLIYREKVFVDERPVTMFGLSASGYVELKRYISGLAAFLTRYL